MKVGLPPRVVPESLLKGVKQVMISEFALISCVHCGATQLSNTGEEILARFSEGLNR
jgi:hypothetical protein